MSFVVRLPCGCGTGALWCQRNKPFMTKSNVALKKKFVLGLGTSFLILNLPLNLISELLCIESCRKTMNCWVKHFSWVFTLKTFRNADRRQWGIIVISSRVRGANFDTYWNQLFHLTWVNVKGLSKKWAVRVLFVWAAAVLMARISLKYSDMFWMLN